MIPNSIAAILSAIVIHLPYATGFIATGHSGKHYIITNWHVCNQDVKNGVLSGNMQDGTPIEGRLVKMSINSDLCAAIVYTPTPTVTLGKEYLPNTTVYTKGYPESKLHSSAGQTKGLLFWQYLFPIEEFKDEKCPEELKPGNDIPSGHRGCIGSFVSRITTLYGRPGSSGSPVLDKSGHLIGVVSNVEGDYETGLVTYYDLRAFLSAL